MASLCVPEKSSAENSTPVIQSIHWSLAVRLLL